MAGRTAGRELALVVAGCALAAAAVVWAAGREWVELVTVRPEPLPPLVDGRTGGQLAPWLPALGWAGLAGAGALLATRGPWRRALGALLVIIGAGAVAGVARAVLVADPGPGWPALAAAGAVAVAAAGAVVLLRGQRWPAMGARYDRAARRRSEDRSDRGEQRPEQVWEALDRGEDPTA